MVLMWCSPGRSGDGYGSIVWGEFTNLRGEKVKFQKNTQLGQPEVHTNGSENHSKKILYKRHTDFAESFNQKPKSHAPGRHNRLFDGVGRSQEGFMNAATGGPIVIRIQSINSEAKIKCKARGTHQSKSELRTIKKGIRFKREWIVRVGRAA